MLLPILIELLQAEDTTLAGATGFIMLEGDTELGFTMLGGELVLVVVVGSVKEYTFS